MSIVLQKLRVKNFLSVGNVEQTVDLNKCDLTLILGENLDLGGDGARNGVGKTLILQAISYALFGAAINQIRKDNLINKTNQKGMLVTLDYSVGDIQYRIVRGRKPNVLRFYINSVEQQGTDDAQGENRETQEVIERVLAMTHDMFQHIVGLNSYTTPFLGMKVSDQRTIIEQLLGITLLSEKAEALKKLNTTIKEAITAEELRIHGVETANKRIREQIDSLKKRQRLWNAKHDEDLAKLVDEYDALQQIDIARELALHKELAQYNAKLERLQRYSALLARQTAWKQKRDSTLATLQQQLDALLTVDITAELAAHEALANYNTLVKDRAEYVRALKRAHDDCASYAATAQKLTTEVHELEQHRCYACGQEFHDSKHSEVLERKRTQLREAEDNYKTTYDLWKSLDDNPVVVPDKPSTHYSTVAEALQHSNSITTLQQRIADHSSEADPYAEQLLENSVIVGAPPQQPHYDTEEAAFKHNSRVDSLLQQITAKHGEVDPYVEQIAEMESTAIVAVSYDALNKHTRVLQHQEYLLDLLTNKKSFVRKRIIEQNLHYLNARLTHYLDKMGLPHSVVFQNDLSVEITELGREMDFYNLSRGEMNRLILALSFSFRDVYENLYHSCNLLFIDELIDNGMDGIGVENSIAVLKSMSRTRGKSIWLVSHRDELTNRVSNILKVIKENGFTNFGSVESHSD